MNKHEQSARFADKSTKAAREIIEGSIRSTIGPYGFMRYS
jgi:hypothetical protein